MKHFNWLLFLSFCFLCSCISDHEDIGEKPYNYVVEGDVIPDFTITEEDGSVLSSTDFAGKRSIIFFFYTGCTDCQRELPKMEKAWKVLKENPDFMLATIARGERKPATDLHWEECEYTMPKYHDPNKDVFLLFANTRVPRMYILDENRKIVWMGIETFEIDERPLEAADIIRLVEDIP